MDNSQITLEVQPTTTVAQMKADIKTQSTKFETGGQKLILKGKVLTDLQTVEEISAKEGDFLVLLYKPPKQIDEYSTIIPQTKPKQITPVTPTLIPSSVNPTPVTVSQVNSPPTVVSQVNSPPTVVQLPTSQLSPEMTITVEEIMSIGFEYTREMVIEAVRAASGDGNRALQFLEQGMPVPLNNLNLPNVPNTNPLPVPGGAGGIAGDDMQLYTGLRNLLADPSFDGLRTALTTNPSQIPVIMQQIIQALVQSHPELAMIIQSQPRVFIAALLGIPHIPGNIPVSLNAIRLTKQEMDDINTLVQFGFSEIDAKQAYLSCDRQIEMASTYLLDRMERGELLSSHIEKEKQEASKQAELHPILIPPNPTTTVPLVSDNIEKKEKQEASKQAELHPILIPPNPTTTVPLVSDNIEKKETKDTSISTTPAKKENPEAVKSSQSSPKKEISKETQPTLPVASQNKNTETQSQDDQDSGTGGANSSGNNTKPKDDDEDDLNIYQ